MDTAQSSAIRSLRLAMVAAFVLPVILFVFLAVTNYRHLHSVADQRLERTVNILQEHALKVFETIERSIAETNEMVRGMSDDEIAADEARLHLRLRQLAQSLPQFKSLWVFDPNGRSLVNSLAYPQPQGLNFADRDYFRAHIGSNGNIFVGQVLQPRDPYPGDDFFSVSRARPSPDGSFRGVIQLSILPTYFEQFFDKLQTTYSGGYASLVREDGALLARHPAFGPGATADHYAADRGDAHQSGRRLHHPRVGRRRRRAAPDLEEAAVSSGLRHGRHRNLCHLCGVAENHDRLFRLRAAGDRAAARRDLDRTRTHAPPLPGGGPPRRGRRRIASGPAHGGDRAIDRRCRARLQQHPDDRERQCASTCAAN